MNTRLVWLENLVAFNTAVQNSGGIMDIVSSYTDADGDVLCEVYYNKLEGIEEKWYSKNRIYKE